MKFEREEQEFIKNVQKIFFVMDRFLDDLLLVQENIPQSIPKKQRDAMRESLANARKSIYKGVIEIERFTNPIKEFF